MLLAADLHIHSALSPCGDNDMTPNNIVNMAVLKGLDIISVTDHNSGANLPALRKVALEKGIMLIPGIEVQTREDVHMLCYFKTVECAVEFGDLIYSKLPPIRNNEEAFGRQLVMDSHDNIIRSLDRLLLSSADISIKQLMDIAHGFGGICIPAHVDRPSYSIVSNLGFITDDMQISTVEISRAAVPEDIMISFSFLANMRMVKSSDAHYLWDILERESFIMLPELTLTNIFNYLKGI